LALAETTTFQPTRRETAYVKMKRTSDEVDPLHLQTASARSMEIAPIDAAIEDVVGRYLALLDDPVGARLLLPLVRKELHFRLLLSKPVPCCAR